MKAAIALLLCFVSIAAYWAFMPVYAARRAVARLEKRAGDPREQVAELRQWGASAGPALRAGLESPDTRVRLVCARELAYLGDPGGDRALLLLMQDRSSVEARTVASAAETHVINAWMERAAPPAGARRKALKFEGSVPLPERLSAITEALEEYPAWASGYVFRARLHLAAERAAEARRDALLALYLQPDQFEAMVLLARAWSLLERNDFAVVCIERAMKVNPRLTETLKEELQSLHRALQLERARERRERQRNQPLA